MGGVQGRAQYRTESASHPAPALQRGAWAGHSHVPRTPHRDVERTLGPSTFARTVCSQGHHGTVLGEGQLNGLPGTKCW